MDKKKKTKKPAPKKKGGRGSKKSGVRKVAKKVVKKSAKKSRGRGKAGAGNLKRYNAVRSALSSFFRESRIQYDRGKLNESASKLYALTKDKPLKYVLDNIDVLYRANIEEKPITTLPESFPFWEFNTMLSLAEFEVLKVGYKFNDGKAQFEFKGDSMDVLTEFRSSGLYRYLRNNYNGSPPDGAVFRLVDTDNKTFVDYEIVTGVDGMEEGEGAEIPPQKPSESVSPPLQAPTFTAQETIAIEREKQKTLKEVQKLMKLGFTKDEIFKLIGK